ncbi:hypothetical protein JD276_00080 [Leucobacter sp. CSA1]|uniref:Uncharacterized protein n=1 Tax=Leucobacter chromiisoli TaxID=2796471 RepID=A0A934Q5I8_9MICO|nr:hypothetical protein [Leucobacter chromiisoli]MBK0417436.1 hypothetical protein [Leucobacter chromiisoli]
MDQSHITEDQLHEALEGYRWALTDALSELGLDTPREEIIARARKMFGDDEPDQQALIVALAEGENGDPVWNLEEEIVDDEESVASTEEGESRAATSGDEEDEED